MEARAEGRIGMERINGEWEGYAFPAIKTEANPAEQADKIGEELAEFRCEMGLYSIKDGEKEFDPLNFSACIELLDVIHGCETMLRMYDQDIVGACAHIVMAKNAARGYYGDVQ